MHFSDDVVNSASFLRCALTFALYIVLAGRVVVGYLLLVVPRGTHPLQQEHAD